MNRRERMVLVEPRGAGTVLLTLRAAEEVRRADFGSVEGEIDPDAVAIAEAIIKRRTGTFDPATFRDRYQQALKELIEAKMKGLPVKAKPPSEAAPVVDLMAALKRSLAQESGEPGQMRKRKAAAGDRRQRTLLLPLSSNGRPKAAPATARDRSRKKA